MPEPFFSVFTPVRNGADYLAQALDSALAQTYPHYEVVVSDNASADATPRLLADYARRDPRLRWSRTDRALDVVENFNRAGELCRGDWVVFLCHDDLLRPDCLQRLAAALQRYPDDRLALLSFAARYHTANGFVSPPTLAPAAGDRYHRGREFLGTALRGRVPDALPGMSQSAVRLDVWRRLGRFDPRFQHCDTFLWFRLLLDHDLLVVPEALVGVRLHGGQGTVSLRRGYRSIREYRQFLPEFLRRHGPALDLPWLTRLVAPGRYLSVAATECVIHLRKRNYDAALGVLRQVPAVWYPVLAALCLRNGLAEHRRSRELFPGQPPKLIYPD